MVYLVAATTQNHLLLEHIKGNAIYRRLNEVEKEQFDDAMIEARQQARKSKNFALADEIRGKLLDMGIVLEDTREGVKWKRV